MSYDFTTLSPSDFEELIADLLSKEWKTRLEIFKAGKDGGIDLLNSRTPAGDPHTIVQCKRYGVEKFGQLFASMVKERAKLDKLKPKRYVLVTSVPLSKSNKEKLLKILKPYCTSTSDIYGADEINALIRDYPSVEQAHFKLWISSTAILERVLHAKVFAVTDATIEATLREVRKLVPHKGLNKALEMLGGHGHVLIVGNPGIGKTTLARMLLCHFMREDFEPVWVVGNIDEAWGIVHTAANTDRKLVLVYDDFLGQLDFSSKRFEKNEDNSLFLLMEKVSKSKNLRLIMTTREYILEDAKRVHGAFATKSNELMKCTLSLGDYSDAARSKVLFNHLYFSDLPTSRMEKLVATKVYQKIVRHRHFNPRVVETISKNANSHVLDDDSFIQFIEQEFENPAKLWEHPFSQEISQLSRQLLIALWSFGRATTLPELLRTIEAMNPNVPIEQISHQFVDSLRQLDGNFITTNRLVNAWQPDGTPHKVARFQNPSVREFVRNLAIETPAWLLRCTESIQSFDQIEEVLQAAEKVDSELLNASFWHALRASALRVETTEHRYESNCGTSNGSSYPALFTEKQLAADVVLILLRIEAHVEFADSRASEIKSRVSTVNGWKSLFARMEYNYSVRGAVERLVTWLIDESKWKSLELKRVQQSFTAATFALLENGKIGDDLWNVRTLVDCVELAKGGLSDKDRSIVKDAIVGGIYSITQDNDADRIGEQLDLLESLAERLDLSLEREKDKLKERMDEVSRPDDNERSDDGARSYTTEQPEDGFNMDQFFRGLLDRNT
jgi:hypothetical protein